MTDISLESLIRVFNKMRDKKEGLDSEVKALEHKMAAIKVAINDMMREEGMESIRTTAGTAYRTLKTTYSPTDWGIMHNFIMERHLPDLLEKRLHQGNMKKYLEENPEDVPPGLNSLMEYSVTVKRSKNGQ